MEGFLEETPNDENPYLELRNYFRLSSLTPLSLKFSQIENILGDKLPWDAYFYEVFWYDDQPGYSSVIWKNSGFPFHTMESSPRNYPIAESWLSQGYSQ